MRLKFSLLLSSCAIAGLVAGCGGDGGGGTGPVLYRVESSTTALSVGQDSSVTVSAAVRNLSEDRVLSGAPVQFRSADYTIAIVNNDGRVTGMKGGTTDILAVYRDDTLRIPVTVRGNPLQPSTFRMRFAVTGSGNVPIDSAGSFPGNTTVSANRDTITLGSAVGFTLTGGQTADVAVYAEDQAGGTLAERIVLCRLCRQIVGAPNVSTPNPTIQRRGVWSSTDTAVATVSNASNTFGRVTARRPGTAKIIFTIPGDEFADTLDVTVIQRRLTGVVIQIASPADPRTPVVNAPLAIARGGLVQLLANPRVSNPNATANDRRVVWSIESTNPAGPNATVDALGAVTACSVVNPQLGCARLANVGDSVVVRATSVPIAGDPTTVFGRIVLRIVTANPALLLMPSNRRP